jgi:polyhydroxyalkanoate synthesis regulator phasin
MTTRNGRRSGIVKYLGNIVDDTKDLVDDLLDRGRDVEHDLRGTARRTFERDDEDEDRAVRQELAALRITLATLTRKVDELATQRAADEKPQS